MLYFCSLRKSVPYVVPDEGYLLDTVDFFTSRFRTWFPIGVIAWYGRLFLFYLDFIDTVLYVFVVSTNAYSQFDLEIQIR